MNAHEYQGLRQSALTLYAQSLAGIREKALIIAAQAKDLASQIADIEGINEPLSSDRRMVESIPIEVCAYYGVAMKDIRSQSRKRILAEPRQVIAYLLRTMTTQTLEEVGYLIRRDHTTVIDQVRTVTAHIDRNPAFRRNIEIIKSRVEMVNEAEPQPKESEKHG